MASAGERKAVFLVAPPDLLEKTIEALESLPPDSWVPLRDAAEALGVRVSPIQRAVIDGHVATRVPPGASPRVEYWNKIELSAADLLLHFRRKRRFIREPGRHVVVGIKEDAPSTIEEEGRHTVVRPTVARHPAGSHAGPVSGFEDNPNLVTIAEAAKLLGVPEPVIRRLAVLGRIHYHGMARLVDLDQLRHALEENAPDETPTSVARDFDLFPDTFPEPRIVEILPKRGDDDSRVTEEEILVSEVEIARVEDDLRRQIEEFDDE